MMVPDKFNMVDMGGIDLIMMQGEEVPGLYDRLVESIAQCRYQCLYNWFFDGVAIPPSYVEMEVGENEEVEINEGITVTPDDIIHIYSVAPPAPEPSIISLSVEENGVYDVPAGVDGFNPVTVDVSSGSATYTGCSVPSNNLGLNGDWYIRKIFGGRLNDVSFDTGINGNTVYGFEVVFKPISVIHSYQSYISGVLDNFTIGSSGSLNSFYVRIRSSEVLSFSYSDLIHIVAKRGAITAPNKANNYSNPIQSTSGSNIFIGGVQSSRYPDFVFASLILYDSNYSEIAEFYYDDIQNSVVGPNGVITPTGSGTISLYDTISLTSSYHKENGIWVKY